MAPLERAWVGQIPIGDNGPKWVRIQSALTPLARSTLKTAWQRLIVAAIDAGVIAAEDRFNLHGLKHRGITDTPRADKRDGAGHVNPEMTVRYGHSVPVVAAPKLPRARRGNPA